MLDDEGSICYASEISAIELGQVSASEVTLQVATPFKWTLLQEFINVCRFPLTLKTAEFDSICFEEVPNTRAYSFRLKSVDKRVSVGRDS